jgi:hypothetical protein
MRARAFGTATIVVLVVRSLVGCGAFTEAHVDKEGGATGDLSDAGADGTAEPAPSADITMIATSDKRLSKIAVGASDVFYTEDGADGSILRLAKTAGATPTTFAAAATPAAIALFGGTLFATSTQANRVTSYLTASRSKAAEATVPLPGPIVADTAGIVFVELEPAGEPGSYALPHALGGKANVVTSNTAPRAVAVDESHVYTAFGRVGATQFVRHNGRAGGKTTTSASFVGDIAAMEVGTTWLYVAAGSRVLGFPLAFLEASAPSVVHDFGAGVTVRSLRATESHLLVATNGGGGTIHALVVPDGGDATVSTVATLPEAQCQLTDMAIDATSIYFLCISAAPAGSVWRVGRPAK